MIKTAAATAIALIALTGCAGTTTATPAVTTTVFAPAPTVTVFESAAAPQAPANAGALTEIPAGSFTVGTDIAPGTYKVTELLTGDDCKWSIYKSGTNQDDVISYDYFVSGLPTVTLKAGQDFDSDDCGTWKKIG